MGLAEGRGAGRAATAAAAWAGPPPVADAPATSMSRKPAKKRMYEVATPQRRAAEVGR